MVEIDVDYVLWIVYLLGGLLCVSVFSVPLIVLCLIGVLRDLRLIIQKIENNNSVG